MPKKTNDELSQIVKNETEWRKELWRKVEDVEEKFQNHQINQATINARHETKMTLLGSFFGFLGGLIVSVIGYFTTK